MTTAKKLLTLAVCLTCVTASMAGCAKNSGAATESSTKTESSDSKTIKELSDKVEKLENTLSDLLGEDINDYDPDGTNSITGDIHPIYDDTAVVEAYKSGDDSKLTDDKDKYILKELKKAVDKIIKDGMSDYDKEKAVYDYVFSQTHFNDDSLAAIPDTDDDESYNPYGFFHDHSTICVGNATTMKLFFDVLGIDSKIIHSTRNGEHAWNVVKIDGKWYHVDVTFDGGEKSPSYAYFNVPDSVKNDGSYPWDTDDFPACTSTDDCYICQNAQKLDSVYDIPDRLKTVITDKTETAYMSVTIPEGVDSDAVAEQITGIISGLYSDKYYFTPSPVVITSDGKLACFSVSVTSYYDNPSDSDDLTDNALNIDYEKLQKAFSDVLDTQLTPDATSTINAMG